MPSTKAISRPPQDGESNSALSAESVKVAAGRHYGVMIACAIFPTWALIAASWYVATGHNLVGTVDRAFMLGALAFVGIWVRLVVSMSRGR